MTRVNYIFGCWGLLNTAGFALYLWQNIAGGSTYFESSYWIGVAVATVVIPFGQVASLLGSLGLNANRNTPSPEKERTLKRWKKILRRTPLASTLLFVLFGLAVLGILSSGGTEVELDGETQENRFLIGFVGVLFSYAPVYVNLSVVRKCQDLIESWQAEE